MIFFPLVVMEIDYPFQERKKIYVRPIYKTFFKMIEDTIQSCKTVPSQLVTRGLGMRRTRTPDVGKSMFLVYVANQLVQSKYNVVVSVDGKSYHSVSGSAFTCTSLEVLQCTVLNDSLALHLYDPSSKGLVREHLALLFFFLSHPLLKHWNRAILNV